MKNYNTNETGNHTEAEWMVIAEQAASKAKEEFNGQKTLPPIYFLLVIAGIVSAIIFALTCLFFPQFIHIQSPESAWLSAHPVANKLLAAAAFAACWGFRIWWHDFRPKQSQDKVNSLKMK